jgi:signal peptidase I
MGNILNNKWFKFAAWTLIYVLIFAVWARNPWMLLGVAVIFDLCITKFLNRTVGAAHKSAKEKNSAYRAAAEWIEAILFAVVVASIVHIFVFQMFVIPSPSMEKSSLEGD